MSFAAGDFNGKTVAMLNKMAAAFVFVALVFALGLLTGLVARRGGFAPKPKMDTAAILLKVQTLSQLVSVKYVLEKVVVLEDAKWYGENRVLLVAHGVVKAGIDLGRLGASDIAVSGTRIKVVLPRPAITDVYLDDHRTRVLERSTGIMRVFDKDLEQNARRQAVEDLRGAAMESGILADASDRAKGQLANLLYLLGFTEVELSVK